MSAMKNPWMSLWRGEQGDRHHANLLAAEARSQQQAFAKEVMKAWGLGGAGEPRKSLAKRRRK